MIDRSISPSIDRLLETPAGTSSIIENEEMLSAIDQERKLDTFQDFEFLELIRREIQFTERTGKKSTSDEAISHLPYTPSKYRILHRLLHFLGYRYFRAGDIDSDVLNDLELDLDDRMPEIIETPEFVQAAEDTESLSPNVEEKALPGEHRIEDQILQFAKRFFLIDLLAKFKKKFFKSKFTLGIDIGTGSVKYVHLFKGKSKYRIDHFQTASMEYHGKGQKTTVLDRTPDALMKLLPYDLLPYSDSYVSFSGLNVLVTTELFPKMSNSEIEEAVRIKQTKNLPKDINDPVVKFEIVDTQNINGVQQMLICSYLYDRAELDAWLTVVNNAGIFPERVNPSHENIVGIVKRYYAEDAQDGVVVLEVGYLQSSMIFIDGGYVRYMRNIQFGTHDLQEVLIDLIKKGETAKLDEIAKAEMMLKNYGIPSSQSVGNTSAGIPLKQLHQVLFPVVESLMVEIQRYISYFKSNFSDCTVRQMILAGGGADLINLSDILSTRLGITTKKISILNNFNLGREVTSPERLIRNAQVFAAPLGLAISHENQINLLPDELLYGKKKNLAWAIYSIITVVIMFILVQNSLTLLTQKEKTVANLVDVQNELNNVLTVNSEYVDLNNQKTALLKVESYLIGQMDETRSYDNTKAILQLISGVSSEEVKINKIFIGERKETNVFKDQAMEAVLAEREIELLCEASASDIENSIMKFVIYIRSLPYFTDVKYFRIPITGGFSPNQFQINMYIKPYTIGEK